QVALAGVERNYALGKMIESVVNEHQALIDQLKCLAVPTRFLRYGLEDVLKKIAKVTPQCSAIVASATKPSDANDAWKTWGFPDIQMVNGLFMRRGNSIELVSSWEEPKDVPGFGICIDAQGGGPGKADGNLILNATGSTMITAGAAGMTIDSKGVIVVE